MFTRIRIALGLAALLTLVLTRTALAKGSFAFIAVSGGSLKTEIRLSNRNLMMDWFAFADFQGGGIPTPAHVPQVGYVITRYYLDGVAGGWSKYDGKWYAAKSGIKGVFQYALVQEEARHSAVIRRS